MPQMPAAVYATVERFTKVFPIPRGNPADPGWDGTIRSYTLMICSQVCHDHGTGYGAKKADPNRPISKDSLAFVPNANQLWAWDLFIGTGTGHPTLAATPTFNNIPEQVFVPVQPVDYLAGNQPGPDPEPEPTPDPGHEEILRRLDIIDAKLDNLAAQQNADTEKLYDQAERIFHNISDQLEVLRQERIKLKGTIRGSVIGGGTVEMSEV